MLEVVEKYYRSSSTPQGPASLAEPSAPATMDFSCDSVHHSFIPSGCNVFPSAWNQTFPELDIDNSLHKLFEGLPEIVEPDPVGRDESVCRSSVVTLSPFFLSTPSAHAGRLSSMPYMIGAVTQAIPALEARYSVPHSAGGTAKAPLPLRPKPQEWTQPVHEAAADFKGGRSFKSRAVPVRSKLSEIKEPNNQSSATKSMVVIPTTSQEILQVQVQAIPLTPITPSTFPKAFPVTSAVADPATVKVNQCAPLRYGVGLGPQVRLHPPKRSRKDVAQAANTRTQKTRYFDKVEHIVRERWRRDDMAGKFLALESLLPPGLKRDRSTILEDSMNLVKSLQHRKREVLKRRSELRSAVASGGPPPTPGVKLNKTIQNIASPAVIPANSLQALESGTPSSSSMALSSGHLMVGTKRPLQVQPNDYGAVFQIPKPLINCVKSFYVQSELALGEIIIEMICDQIPHFHSLLMKSMESLCLDVIRCSVTKTVNQLICNIAVKPFPSSTAGKLSSTCIMEALNSVFRTSYPKP